MTIGDVLAVIAGILATGVTLRCALVALAMLFSTRTTGAAQALEAQPGRMIGTGAFCSLTAGTIAWVLAFSPAVGGLPKLFGWVALILLLAVAALGSAGLAQIAATRIQQRDTRIRPMDALGWAATLLTAAGFLPVLGWFFLFPLMLWASLGAGFSTLLKKRVPLLGAAAVVPVSSGSEAAG